jgi:hypothetical protein
MKNMFDAPTADEVKSRVARLTPGSERLWGKMSAAQAMAHCSLSMEWAVGDTIPPTMFAGRLMGRLVKPFVFGDDKPFKRNSPTAKTLVVDDERNLETERTRLVALIDRFTGAGPAGCSTHPHSFFGRLTPQEWAVLTYKHLDHHLRQFGV